MNKQLPNDIKAEQSVLAAMILDNSKIEVALQILKGPHFFNKRHQIIFCAIINLHESNVDVDAITLHYELKRTGEGSNVGGPAYIADMLNNFVSSENIEMHAKIVYEKHLLREIIATSQNLIKSAYQHKQDAFDLLDTSIQNFESLKEVLEYTKAETNIAEYLDPYFQNVREQRESGITPGLKTKAMPSFSTATDGILPGDMLVVSGKDKAGKTTFALELLCNLCFENSIPGAAFTYEMPVEQYATKIFSQKAPVRMGYLRNPAERAKDGHFRFSDEKLTDTVVNLSHQLHETKLFVVDEILDDVQLLNKIKYMVRKYGIQIVMIDYISLIETRGAFERNDLRLASISRRLKNITRELNIRSIVLSQENDEGSTAESKALRRDCDFWFSISNPHWEKRETITHEGVNYKVDQGHRVIRFNSSRHGATGGRFYCYHHENGAFNEIDITRQ